MLKHATNWLLGATTMREHACRQGALYRMSSVPSRVIKGTNVTGPCPHTLKVLGFRVKG